MIRLSRRTLLKQSTLAAFVTLAAAAESEPAHAIPVAMEPESAPRDLPLVELHWLEGEKPAAPLGATWGIPWAQGVCPKDTSFALRAETNGPDLPLQSWPLATWPDGSWKWTAHAAGPEASENAAFSLVCVERPQSPSRPVSVKETADAIEVDTGVIRCRFAKRGNLLIESLARDGRTIAERGQLVCLRQDSPDLNRGNRREEFLGTVEKTVVEQSGPVRAVVRVDGRHRSARGRQEWLPFTVRFYLYAGSDALRLVHSFVYDGDENRDFLSGLGLRFAVPLRDALHDRHVRFVGAEGGLWGEGVRTLTGLRRDPGAGARTAQVQGRATPPIDTWPESVRARQQYIPAWGDYTLTQLSADGFEIRKRTKPGHAWVRAAAGRRAAGAGYIGGVSGGIAFGVRDFWQRYPAQIDLRGAASESAGVTLWFWAPDAPAMDLRFYHDGMGMNTHPEELQGLEITYEDYEKGWGKPYGIARTGEITLWALATTPPREQLLAMASVVQKPPLPVCRPERLHAAGVFGDWSLPDRSTPARKRIEDQLEYLLALYLVQPEQRRWYGFWDYGDVMHSYDSDRHEWRYDVGGFAWANSELSPDLWLWYSFLRTGRADLFRFAEAMGRHTGEVDTFHLGPFRGLGTRHGVQHWGDSSKQPRVSTAAYRRFYYYLTADERTGDLLRGLLDGDRRLSAVDIGRKLARPGAPKPRFQTYMGFGTSWCSLAAAWLTEWERTGDTRWRDRLLNGMQGIGAMPNGWLTGGAGYDPDSGRFLEFPDQIGISHLNAVFGAVEVSSELIRLLPVPEYERAWLTYCEVYNAPPAERQRIAGRPVPGNFNLGESHSRLTAYAAHRRNDPALAARAWKEFLSGAAGLGVHDDLVTHTIPAGPMALNAVTEGYGLSTNAASQWGLAAIQNLALIGDRLPERITP